MIHITISLLRFYRLSIETIRRSILEA